MSPPGRLPRCSRHGLLRRLAPVPLLPGPRRPHPDPPRRRLPLSLLGRHAAPLHPRRPLRRHRLLPRLRPPPRRRLPFFRDLASPIPTHRGAASRFASSGATPPPPLFTLDDRFATADFSPASDLLPVTGSPSPRAAGSRSPTWDRSRGKNSAPMDGVVEPHRMTASEGKIDGEEWVTVFGFSLRDTNLVLREFEKCGVILRHHSRPREGNWIHILYQHSYDARKALQKNGIQLISSVIIGVKHIDPTHRQQLDDRFTGINQGCFMVSLPSKSLSLKSTGASNQLGALPRPYDPKSSTNVVRYSGRRTTGSVAAPAKSIVTNVMDLIFGI